MALTSITIEGVAATANARNVNVVGYGEVSKRGSNVTIPHRDGEWTHNPKYVDGSNLMLEVVLKTVPSPEENLSDLIAAFNKAFTTSTISATHDYAGSVRTEVELLRAPIQSPSNPNVYRFILRNPKGSWEQVTATTSTGNSGTPAAITTSGDTPIDDFTVLFATTGTVTHTNSAGTVASLTLTAGAASNVTVDLGNRTVKTSTGGNQDAYLTVTQPYWMRFEAGSTQNLTATMNHTFTWRNKWAV
jgi:hypothetical protein